MSKNHFDVDDHVIDIQELIDDNINVDQQTPKPKLKPDKKYITVPLFGFRATRLQIGLVIAAIVGSIVFQISMKPKKNKAPPEFTTQHAIDVSPPSQNTLALQQAIPPTVDTEELQMIREAFEAQRIYAQKNREAISALVRRIENLEQQQKALSALQMTSTTPSNRVVATNSRSTKPGVRNTNIPGAKIESIYPGMAWIYHKGSTFAVRPGDKINGLTITRIDDEKREVQTSGGTIR